MMVERFLKHIYWKTFLRHFVKITLKFANLTYFRCLEDALLRYPEMSYCHLENVKGMVSPKQKFPLLCLFGSTFHRSRTRSIITFKTKQPFYTDLIIDIWNIDSKLRASTGNINKDMPISVETNNENENPLDCH